MFFHLVYGIGNVVKKTDATNNPDGHTITKEIRTNTRSGTE